MHHCKQTALENQTLTHFAQNNFQCFGKHTGQIRSLGFPSSFAIMAITPSSVLEGNKGLCCKSSAMIHPTDHMSMASVYVSRPNNTSGALHTGSSVYLVLQANLRISCKLGTSALTTPFSVFISYISVFSNSDALHSILQLRICTCVKCIAIMQQVDVSVILAWPLDSGNHMHAKNTGYLYQRVTTLGV